MTLVAILINILIIALVAGLIWALVSYAPFIPEPFKAIAKWAILAIAVIWIIFMVLGGAPAIYAGGPLVK